ncbi:MAG: hypothetical protein GY913_35105 [Proteobacteria bacterium]|nr:hypothetical protein [Pseudomonadota bacterium]
MTWLVGAALAAGTAVHAPGTEAAPEVALDGVPESADVQPLDPEGEPHQVRARLLLDRAEVRPGETVRLGVHLEQKTDWHTYWVSPGEVGKPTVIDWTVPEGSTVGERIHPAPAWFELSGIISYGYEDQVLHHVDVTLPDDISGEVTFGATADWLVCEIQCIPGEAELTLTVPVATEGQVQPTPWVALFDHAEGTFPTPMLEIDAFSIESAVSTSAVRPDDEFQVAIRLAPTGKEFDLVEEHGHWPMFTPIASPGWMMMDKSVTVNDDGSVLVLLDGYALENEDGSLPTDQVAGALFQVEVDGEWIRAEYRTPIEFVAADTEVLASTSPLFGDGAAALTPTEGPAVEPANVETPKPFSILDTLPYLGLAFLGGILLNIMPCVLPVITLKLYGLVEQAHITSEERRKAGTFYTLGIMASFGALAGVIVILQQVMDFQAGWGFQFQYPPYVIGLATIVFAFGLSLFGVFEIPAFGEDSMAQASDKEGAMGYFLTGAFATLLATP